MEPIDALPEWVQIFSSLGLGFVLLVIIAVIIFLPQPFFVYGVYNQTKRVNKNLNTIISLLQMKGAL